MAGHSDDVFHHIRDSTVFEFPFGITYQLPAIAGFQITKYMVLQVVALVLALVIFRGLAKRVATGLPVRGRWWNFWEALALFIRDEVVRPTIGDDHAHGDHDHAAHDHDAGGHGHTSHHAEHPITDGVITVDASHPADRFLPFVWSCFFYILFANLLGALPWLGSPTANISVTAVLAIAAFVYVVISGSQAQGAGGFWKNLAPDMGVPGVFGALLTGLVWIIEFFGLIVKHGVLAVRLFANIMAGHTVIAVMLGFIAAEGIAGTHLFWVVTPASIVGQIGIGLLELFVAFLQAYVFAFLTTLFIGMAQHAH